MSTPAVQLDPPLADEIDSPKMSGEQWDGLAIYGAEVMTFGQAMAMPAQGVQDAADPWRRMCRWIVEEHAGA